MTTGTASPKALADSRVGLLLLSGLAFFWGVNKHPHPRDESEKYVALAIVQDHRRGAHIVTSPDGIHWSCSATPFGQTPHDVSSKGDDCLMHIFFDHAKQKWALYRRIVPEFSGLTAEQAFCEKSLAILRKR